MDEDINEFKGYQPNVYFIQDKTCNPLTDFHTIIDMWKNFFTELQLLSFKSQKFKLSN